jgi:hypothetical protein
MRQLKGACGLLLISGLAACVPELSRQYVIGDQVWAYQSIDVRPALGDVLYLTTWANGVPVPSAAATRWNNGYPPMLATERIPLRHVDDEDSLLPLEAALLGAALATHIRQTPPTAGAIANLENALKSEQVALWNSFVASLLLQKDKSPPPAGARSIPMQIQVDERAFCHQLTTQTPNGGTHTAARTLILTTYFGATADGSCDGNQPSDLRKIGRLESALAPLTEIRSNLKDKFYSPDDLHMTVGIARVELQLAGVSIREHNAMEARWTLAQWEAARICQSDSGTPLSIARIQLGWRHGWLQVLPTNTDGSRPAAIEVFADPGRREGRQIQRKGHFLGANTISHDSLKFLYPADITAVNWGTDTTSLDPALRAACTVK